MKETKQYICELCHTAYNDKKRCIECEKKHKTIKRIASTTYKSMGAIPDGAPIKIEVEFEDGVKIVYKRWRRMTNFEKIKQMTVEEMADIQGYEGLYKIDWKA